MTRTHIFLLAALLSAFAGAQGTKPSPGVAAGSELGGGLQLLGRQDVHTDIGLTKQQWDKVGEIRKSIGEAARAIHKRHGSEAAATADLAALRLEHKKRLEAELTAEQLGRLKQIEFQLQGNLVMANPEVAAILGLTEEQNARIKALQEEQRKAYAVILAKVRDRQLKFDGAMKELNQKRSELEANLGKVPTPEQNAKLSELRGRPFIPAPPPSNKIGG